jgi:hypothetical protein
MEKEQKKQVKKEISTEKIAQVMKSMVDVFHQEENNFYKELSKDVKKTDIDNYDDFYRKLVRPAEKYWGGFIRTEITNNNEMVFFLINSNFIENNFRYWIEKKEGSACSSDKSRAIMKRLYYWIKDEQKIIFDANEEYTYHHTKKIFTTHDEIDAFYLSLHHLHYGNPQQYLSIISEILKK